MATTTMGTNRKKLLLPTTMSRAGWALVEARADVEGVSFAPSVPKAELHRLLEDVAGVALGVQPFSDPELDAAPGLEVVSRIGVGYDAVDVPALTRRKIPLMIGGTANSVSVAEAGVFLIMSLARRFHYDPLPENPRDGRPVQRRPARAYEEECVYRQHRARRHHRREGALR